MFGETEKAHLVSKKKNYLKHINSVLQRQESLLVSGYVDKRNIFFTDR